MALPAYVRQAHRIVTSFWLLLILVALSLEFVGGIDSSVLTLPIVGLLILMVITGVYMLLRPWVRRFRAA